MKRNSIVLVFALLFGCAATADESVRYADLKDDDVMAVIGGRDLEKGQYERQVRFRMMLEAKRNPRMTMGQARKLESSLYEGGIDYQVQKRAYMEEAAARKIRATEEDLNAARKRFLRKYSPGKQKSWTAFTMELGSDAAEQANEELAFEALRIKVDKTLREQLRSELTAEELDNMLAQRDAYNARTVVTNAAVYALATNVWREIVADKSPDAFERKAKQLNDPHVIYDPRWNGVAQEFFKDEPAMREWLPKLKVGDVTPPIEGDNGLVILQLTGKEMEQEFSTRPRQMIYDFRKIFFELPAFAEEVPREVFAKRLADRRADQSAQDIIQARSKSIVVNYPKGKVVFK